MAAEGKRMATGKTNEGKTAKGNWDYDQLFPPVRLSRLKRYRPDPEDRVAGLGFLKRGAACLLTGGTGIGKSVLGEQIAVCVAAGKDLPGGIKVPKPRRVLYIEAENDMEILKQDFLSITAYTKAPRTLVEKNLTIRHVPGMPESVFGDFLEHAIRRVKPDLLVLDPYQSFIGSVDINSTEPFFRWRVVVEGIIYDYKTALLLITHTPKPQDRKGWTSEEMIYLAAGTSAMANWARTAMEIIPVQNDIGRYRLHFSKAPSRSGLTNGDGTVLRDIFIEHSGSIEKPYWKLSPRQGGGVRVNKEAVVKLCSAEHPKWTVREISEHLHLPRSTVSRYMPSLKERREMQKRTRDNKRKEKKQRRSGSTTVGRK